jgi:VanZ family protein
MTLRLTTTACARAALLLVLLACVVFAVGPFQTLEYELIPWDKAAHFIAFYLVTSLLFLSFPRRRRLDLACLATLAGVGLEIAQLASGRDAELDDMLANACGAFAVVAPGYLEMARQASRVGSQSRKERRRAPLSGLKDAKPASTPIADLT